MDPTFVIAGAQRCGTTSLWHLLDEHPQIYMARPPWPEPKFFAQDSAPGHDRAWYVDRWFSETGTAMAVGEKSASYMDGEGVSRRVKQMFPHMRLVFILRHPVERAISNYRYSRQHGLETEPFDFAVREEARRVRETTFPNISRHPLAYLQRGRYADYLERFLEDFARDSMHIILHERLRNDPEGLCRDVYRFLGVDPQFWPASLGERHRAHADDDLMLSRATFDYMIEQFREPNRRLEQMVGQDLSHWNRETATIEKMLR